MMATFMEEAETAARIKFWMLGEFESLAVYLRVRFDHAIVAAKMEGARAGALAKRSSKWRVVENACERGGEVSRVAGTERQASFAQHFRKRAEVRCHNGQSAQHIFSHHQAEDFAANRRNNDYGGLYERSFNLPCAEASSKTNY